MNYTADITAM